MDYNGLSTIPIHTTTLTSSGTEQKDDRTSPAFIEQQLIPQERVSDESISHGWTRLPALLFLPPVATCGPLRFCPNNSFNLARWDLHRQKRLCIGHFSAAEGYKWFQYSVPPNSGSDRLLLEWSASQLNGLSLFSSRVNCNYPILSFYFWSNPLFWLLTLRSSHVAMENPSVVDDNPIKAFI
jgi:hypothetical protein